MKKLIMSVIAVAAFVPALAMAANIDGQAIFPGNQNQVWDNPSESVQVKMTIEADSSEVVHAVKFDFADGDNLSSVCKDISNFEGAQTKTITTSVNLPPNTGDYGLDIFVFTAANMQEANARNGSAACQGANTMEYTEDDVVHVVPNGGSNNNDDNGGSGTGGNDNSSTTTPAWFTAWLATQNTGNDENKFLCAAFKTHLSRSTQGIRTPWNAVLQGFLIGAGESIPSLVPPVSADFGWFKNETSAAVGHFQTVHKCV